jgi:hypothetical protein
MKTSILFCCLMIVGGLAFGQRTLTPNPGDVANTPGAVVSPPGTSTSGGSSGTTVTVPTGGGGDGGGMGDELYDWFLDVLEAFEYF